MHIHRHLKIFLLILFIGFAPLAAACSPFGDDDEDDDAQDGETPTVAVADTPEAEEEESPEPEGEASPEPDGEESPAPDAEGTPDTDETVTGDPPETPPRPEPGETPEATPDDEAEEETPETTPEDRLATGEDIFTNVCAACHQAEGQGIEGIYPALNGNAFVTLEDPAPVTSVVLTGRGGMPRFADSYSNEEIAGIISFIRTAWENDASEVDPATVQEIRESLEDGPEDESQTGGEQTDDPN